jgi:hypothetical protein
MDLSMLLIWCVISEKSMATISVLLLQVKDVVYFLAFLYKQGCV